MIKTDFGLDLQGYIVPDAMNKELAKKPQKFFSKSTVVFNTEVITTSSPSKTREEVRKEEGIQKIGNKRNNGLGSNTIGGNNNVA